MVATLIRLCDVGKDYRPRGGVPTPALRGVNLTVEQGEFLAIMGPSGSGKTTLTNIVGLLDGSFLGDYRFEDHDVRRLGSSRIAELRGRRIGFVFQQFHLLPRTTVLENVLLPTQYSRVRDATSRALELIESVGLASLLNRRSNQLSGGQMQRVAIARALMMDPTLIIADEPTGNLDSETTAEIMTLFSQLHARGHTIMVITHDPEVAGQARRTIVLRDGQVRSSAEEAA